MPSVIETAALLGVSDRQVRNLVERGELASGGRGRVEQISLDAYVARRGEVQRRVWEPRTAWAALELLTGGSARWLGSSQRSRLRQELASLDAERAVSKLRNRAEVRRYRVGVDRLPAVTRRLAVSRTGDTGLDGYVDEPTLYRLISEQQMVRSERGNLTVRLLPPQVGQDFAAMVLGEGTVVVAVDLATSTEPDEREIGLRLLSEALEQIL